jgi:hypothetical protein
MASVRVKWERCRSHSGVTTMSISKPAHMNEAKDLPAFKAVDVAGQVWRHSNLAELYRFLKKRNDLLKTIIASQR